MTKFVQKIDTWLQRIEQTSLFGQAWLMWLVLVAASVVLWCVISTSLDLLAQLQFSLLFFLVALLVRSAGGRYASLILILISVVTSMRYMYWRLTETVGFHSWVDALFGWGLVAAELYALLTLLLGYFQTARPLQRRPIPIQLEDADLPTVDIFIPTYNEPLEVVRQTILSSLMIDWPSDKLKVYVLDDGYRSEFMALCNSVGAGYIARANNQHAKAGNINNALKITDGEYIAIFDSDHIPTRSFLQVCLGWFIQDPQLAMLQTPHVFFSPDPFEKNLETFRQVPNEGELFYGLVQDGNDLWNATFFCGSCALLRRKPLVELGGIATESVTEDALTAMRLNRLGYNTAYLAVPQAAGLATENLSRHIGQRIRWARGMAQIFRIDNPLLGKGLNLGQRLCYLNAMMHFFFGLPRLVFLTAPLAFLLFDIHIFEASALMIAVYALPHIIQSNLANSFIQGRFRHSFWNEVYESVLAWYIARPVLMAMISPKSGSFNVTAKGNVLGQSYFDWGMATPYIILFLLNLAGVVAGVRMLLFSEMDQDLLITILMNMLWTTYNMVISGASVAVANETKQFRANPRVPASLLYTLVLPNGEHLVCETTDFSPKGLGLRLPKRLQLEKSTLVNVILRRGSEENTFAARVMFNQDERLGLQFEPMDVHDEMALAAMTFSRADAWTSAFGQSPKDAPLTSLGMVYKIGCRGIGLLLYYLCKDGPRQFAQLGRQATQVFRKS